jgi:hypothetical protein
VKLQYYLNENDARKVYTSIRTKCIICYPVRQCFDVTTGVGDRTLSPATRLEKSHRKEIIM